MSTRVQRKIIQIDEEKCNGCGLCVPSCAEGAIQIIDGKARLVSEVYCDGLGACLGECPQDAIHLVEREAEAFDETAAAAHIRQQKQAATPEKKAPLTMPELKTGSSCPGLAARSFTPKSATSCPGSASPPTAAQSELSQWPIQLHLVPITAPYWQNAKLLICADCVAVAHPNLHAELLRDRRIIIACPKLDDTSTYIDKLSAIFSANEIQDILVVRMEVPCCSGLVHITRQALTKSGKNIPLTARTIDIRGTFLD